MIRLIKSTFYNEDSTKKELCCFIAETKKLSMGEKCLEFEEKFSKYQGRRFSAFFNSGSSANLALLQALVNLHRLKQGDRVGFSALTWATNPMPILQLGLVPIPIDVDLKCLNITSDKLEETIRNAGIKALFVTNLLGFCGDLDRIMKICNDKGILLLEDNCESIGSELNGIKLGNFGAASSFSFFVGHHMSTIEGGMVCTDDGDLHEMLKMVRAHGWSRNLGHAKQEELRKDNKIDEFYNNYTFYVSAYNFRPTEINGFLGINQLQYIDEIHSKRQLNFFRFKKTADLNKDFEALDVGHMSLVSNFAYPLICRSKKSFEHYRAKFISEVEIRPIVGGSMVRQPFFQEYLSKNKLSYDCGNADKIHSLGFYFPNNPELSADEIEKIISLLK